MKKILYVLSLTFVLVLSGCGSYTRDESAGEIKTISVAEMEKMMKDKESFPIVFTQSWCTHCAKFKAMLEDYLPKHHVVLYDVVIDKDPNPDGDANIKKIQSYFESLETTPSLYYVENGKLKEELEPGDDGLTETKFDSWVQKLKLDEKQ